MVRGSWWEKGGEADSGCLGSKDISPWAPHRGLGFHAAAPPPGLGHVAHAGGPGWCPGGALWYPGNRSLLNHSAAGTVPLSFPPTWYIISWHMLISILWMKKQAQRGEITNPSVGLVSNGP